MRDRLVKLIIKAGATWNPCNIADHLLAEGVIVPPYKPLPLVWPDNEFAERVLCPICETDLMGCYLGEENPTVVTCYNCGTWIDSTKAVTQEEAEKALAEWNENATPKHL